MDTAGCQPCPVYRLRLEVNVDKKPFQSHVMVFLNMFGSSNCKACLNVQVSSYEIQIWHGRGRPLSVLSPVKRLAQELVNAEPPNSQLASSRHRLVSFFYPSSSS